MARLHNPVIINGTVCATLADIDEASRNDRH